MAFTRPLMAEAEAFYDTHVAEGHTVRNPDGELLICTCGETQPHPRGEEIVPGPMEASLSRFD